MILPSKYIPADRCILTIGSELLRILTHPMTVSSAWEIFQRSSRRSHVSYEWFILSLDFLFLLGALTLQSGTLERVSND